MRRMSVQKGYMKFWRLGTIEFGEQSRWSRAPRSRGLWAFPFPFYDTFFTFHKYTDLIPKRLRGENADWDEQYEWIKTTGRKVLPIREFWYQGDVFSHFMPNGDIGNTGIFLSSDTEWSVTDVTKLEGLIASSGGNKANYRYGEGENSKVELVRSSVDHLEVFIAPGMGRIRESAPGRK